MTQTQATDDGGGIGRRDYIRLVIGATAAVGGITAGSTTSAAQSCDPEQSLSCSYGGEPDYGVSYLIGRVKEHFSGLGSDYNQLQEEELYTQAHYDAEIIKSGNDSVLTSIENLLANAKSVAYQIGRAKFIERLNAGDTVADATSKAKTAITGYFVPTQKNLIERFSVMVTQIEMLVDRAVALSSLSKTSLFNFSEFEGGSFSVDYNTVETGSVSLLDGSNQETLRIDITPGDNTLDGNFSMFSGGANYKYAFVKSNPYDDSQSGFLFGDSQRFVSVWNKIETKHSEARSELQSFADGIKDQYQAGDISTEDLVTPRDLWEMSSDDAETPYAAADLAGLGLEVNQDSAVVVDLLTDGIKREGSVYLSKSPIGGSLAVGNVYDPGLSRSTDADGNYTDSQSDYAGTESDPYPIDGLAFLAYNTDNGSTYDQIKQPFKVDSVFGEDGEELQSAGFAPSTGQQTTTTDIDELRSELQSLNDEIIELEKERAELATSGGGPGIFGGSDGGVLAAAAAVGGIGIYLLSGGGGR